MCPRLVFYNEPDSTGADAVFICQFLAGDGVGRISGAYFAHLLSDELVASIVFSLRKLRMYLAISAAFLGHVATVIFRRSQEEMIGAHAGRSIAVMTDLHPFGDRPEMQLPREAVSHDFSVLPNIEVTIPIRGVSSGPKPAALCFVHSCPKLFREPPAARIIVTLSRAKIVIRNLRRRPTKVFSAKAANNSNGHFLPPGVLMSMSIPYIWRLANDERVD